ncbi:MAG: cell cycle protein [Epsilonproteobacteria bacterium]|nr:cell cycle protein [Campylobacterota bacterium]NPA89176.1 FtsW/RodA/SpoVE family cell cycle protein [Campylobacterota bacterium]
MQKIDFYLFGIVVIIMGIGLIASYSLPIYFEYIKDLPSDYFFMKELAFTGVSLILMFILALMNPRVAVPFFGTILLIIPLLVIFIMPFLPPSLVPVINGAKRWIKIFGLKVAPVEFFKIGFIFFLAWSFNRKIEKKERFVDELKMIFPYLGVLLVVAIFVVFVQSDLGQIILLTGVLFTMLLMAGGSFRIIGTIFAFGWLLLALAILTSPYRYERLEGWLQMVRRNFVTDSNLTSPVVVQTKYQQVANSLNGIYHGGLFGQGLGNGIFKLGFINDVHTDFVIAGLAEEIGVIGIIGIIFLFILLLWRIYRTAYRVEEENRVLSLFAFGIGTLIMLQFFLNIFGITSVIPLKGIPIPFISYGGSSEIALAIGIGLVLAISKLRRE